MADLGLALSSVHAAAGSWLRRGLPLLLPLALTAAGWLTVALMLRGEGALLAGPFADERLQEIFASLCRSDASEPWWTGLAGHLAMWSAMTLGMMLPCALPAWRMLLRDGGWVGGYGFLLGYGGVWAGFALAAAGIATAGASIAAGLQFPAATQGFGAAALILAGLYQLSPFKAATVAALHRNRSCTRSSTRHGLAHGMDCLRSDAVPMGLMLLPGGMNLQAMLALSVLMLLEKAWPDRRLTQASGLVLLSLGATIWATGS